MYSFHIKPTANIFGAALNNPCRKLQKVAWATYSVSFLADAQVQCIQDTEQYNHKKASKHYKGACAQLQMIFWQEHSC